MALIETTAPVVLVAALIVLRPNPILVKKAIPSRQSLAPLSLVLIVSLSLVGAPTVTQGYNQTPTGEDEIRTGSFVADYEFSGEDPDDISTYQKNFSTPSNKNITGNRIEFESYGKMQLGVVFKDLEKDINKTTLHYNYTFNSAEQYGFAATGLHTEPKSSGSHSNMVGAAYGDGG